MRALRQSPKRVGNGAAVVGDVLSVITHRRPTRLVVRLLIVSRGARRLCAARRLGVQCCPRRRSQTAARPRCPSQRDIASSRRLMHRSYCSRCLHLYHHSLPVSPCVSAALTRKLLIGPTKTIERALP